MTHSGLWTISNSETAGRSGHPDSAGFRKFRIIALRAWPDALSPMREKKPDSERPAPAAVGPCRDAAQPRATIAETKTVAAWAASNPAERARRRSFSTEKRDMRAARSGKIEEFSHGADPRTASAASRIAERAPSDGNAIVSTGGSESAPSAGLQCRNPGSRGTPIRRPGGRKVGRVGFRAISTLLATALSVALVFPASAFESAAKAAYVLDLGTGTVLFEKRADDPLPPASMSKLMTLYMIFEALRDGRITLETRFDVSERAVAIGGSSMFLNDQDRPTVEELIKGIVVLSGNDACIAAAEGLAGSEEEFARLMTLRGKELGLTNSNFENSSGWPGPNHRMSMRDLGALASRLILEFPEYYGYFGMKEFVWDGRTPDNRFNRNPLLGLGIGADGLKTGYTRESGYGFVGSARQGSRRIVFAIAGMDSSSDRAEEAERMVNWAFRQFVEKTVVREGEILAEVPVWLGSERAVGLTVAEDVSLPIPVQAGDDVDGRAMYLTPVEAPIRAGQELGDLVISVEGLPETRVTLVADRDVQLGGLLARFRAIAQLLTTWRSESSQGAG